jgi:hypothetical protein
MRKLARSHVRPNRRHSALLSSAPSESAARESEGLWQFVTAEEIRGIEHCNAEIQTFLGRVSADRISKPETWKHLTGFVKIIPNRKLFPHIAKAITSPNRTDAITR